MDARTITRRRLLQAAAASGGLAMFLRGGFPGRLLAARADEAALRVSRLFPPTDTDPGLRLVHADMHNHTLFSDGDGDPALFYTRVRDAGLDVASLTDHSTLQWGLPEGVNMCDPFAPFGADADCQAVAGMVEDAWILTKEYADEVNVGGTEDDPGFTAIRGFEWTSPVIGHSNVWFTEKWTDPAHTGGIAAGTEAADFAHQEGAPGELARPVADALAAILDALDLPAQAATTGYFQWLTRSPDTPLVEGGNDGIFGFNHPGREPGRFDEFRFETAVLDQCVGIEMLNRREDYLFEGVDLDRISPLVRCLDRGWRPGIMGVTDEHGTDWGTPTGKGRAGVWVQAFTRAGVKKGMQERTYFATRQKGLRVDGAANGVRMGQAFRHTSGPVLVQLDVDRGEASYGKTLLAQVLVSSNGDGVLPKVHATHTFTLPRPEEPVVEFTVDIDPATDGNWMVVRLTDPEGTFDADSNGPDGRATGAYVDAGYAVAYLSPWWFDDNGVEPPASGRAPGTVPDEVEPSDPPTTAAPTDPPTTPAPSDDPSGSGTPSPTPSATASPTASETDDDVPPSFGTVTARVRRLSGQDRFATAVDITRNTHPAGQAVVYVATGTDFPDALSVGPLAGAGNAPVLLVSRDTVPPVVAEELRRLEPERIAVLGGDLAVSDAVVATLGRIAPTERLAGTTRYDTAIAVSRNWDPGVDQVWVASGEVFPDALAAGPAAVRDRSPLLLVPRDTVPTAVLDELRRLRPGRIVLVGGTSAVSATAAATLADIAPVERRAGETRYDTAAAASAAAFTDASVVLVATGESFPDALAAGPAAATRRAPLLLVTADTIPPATDAELRRLRPAEILVAGGPLAVGDAVEARLRRYETG